jgi:mitotic spindle assembly checkpoint protein MAD2
MSFSAKLNSINDYTILLKGSSNIVSEYFGYSINSILYQRGLYDPSTFNKITKYGMQLQITTDPALTTYLNNILNQLNKWLEICAVRSLVLVISHNNETLERWVFNVETNNNTDNNASTLQVKDEKLMNQEIGAILRQICSCVSFLPLLPEGCVFDLLVYTPNDCRTPELWEESDPKYIAENNEVKLRSFNTNIHQVQTSVAYKIQQIF